MSVVQANADAVGHPATPSGALVGRTLADGLDQQLLHLASKTVALDARRAGVNHVPCARHRERGLGHVGGQHDAPTGVAVKNPVLLGWAQAGEQRQHLSPAHDGLVAQMLAQMVGRFADFALARQENQNVALVVRVAPKLVHAIGNRAVEVVLAAFFKRAVTLLDREHAARDHDDRRRNHVAPTLPHCVWVAAPRGGVACLGSARRRQGLPPRFALRVFAAPRGGVACLGSARRQALPACEMIRKTLRIYGGRGHHDFQIGPARQNLAQVAEQEVDVQAALVGLVNDDGVIGIEQRVGLGFGQQDAVSHQLDRGVARKSILKSHLEADHIAQRGFELLGDALGHAGGGNAPGLGVADQLGMLARRVIELAAPQSQCNLG